MAFDVSEPNRAQRRRMAVTKTFPASGIKVMRWGTRICIGMTEPGYASLTEVEAVQLADALLHLAGEPKAPEGDTNP